ncbi:MAG: hypothetical protein JOZ18_09640 [Chloroflexi bacterium]|nr:hypothetical protein [Chloroflexota bacterium]
MDTLHTSSPAQAEEEQALTSRRFELSDPTEAVEFFYRQGWTDGLPVVPPTPERVSEFLEYAGRFPGDILGVIPARNRVITAEKVAINAVMAGCLPNYMPVIVAAIEAMCQEQFNLHGISATTGGTAPLLIVSGSVAQQLNINSGVNCFGPGVRANATIGRAIRLILMNVGGSIPGVLDKACLGHPGKYSYCIAEDEERNPWGSLGTERGMPEDVSSVTVFAGEAPHYVNSQLAGTGERLVGSIVNTMMGTMYRGGKWVLVLCPEHVTVFKKEGWTKPQIRQAVYDRAERPLAEFKRLNGMPDSAISPEDERTGYHYMSSPDDLLIITAGGGAGGFSAIVPPWAAGADSLPVTRAIGVCIDCN